MASAAEFADISEINDTSFHYIFEKNVSVPLMPTHGLVRVNVFKPRGLNKVPIIMTYGKDMPYK